MTPEQVDLDLIGTASADYIYKYWDTIVTQENIYDFYQKVVSNITEPHVLGILKENPKIAREVLMRRRYVNSCYDISSLYIPLEEDKKHDKGYRHGYRKYLTYIFSQANAQFVRDHVAELNEYNLWSELCVNNNPCVAEIIIANLYKLRANGWIRLSASSNPIIINSVLQTVRESNFPALSMNTSDVVISYLQNRPEIIHWKSLCSNTNPSVLPILRDNIDKLDWEILAKNPLSGIAQIFLDNLDAVGLPPHCCHPFKIEKICNPEMFAVLLARPKWIDIGFFHKTRIEGVVEHLLCKLDLEELNRLRSARHIWHDISKCALPELLDFLEDHLDKVSPTALCQSKTPNLIPFLRRHPELIIWDQLLKYPTQEKVHFLRENTDKLTPEMFEEINYYEYSAFDYFNTGTALDLVYTLDYTAMSEQQIQKDFYEELLSYLIHPDRLVRFKDKYGLPTKKFLYMYCNLDEIP